MRVHVGAATAVGLGAGALPLGPAEEIALLLCVALVLAAEVLNTGIEALVDLTTARFDLRARLAKDAAAGAVLVLAAGAVLVLVAVLARTAPWIAAHGGALAIHAALAAPVLAAAALLVSAVPRAAAIDVVALFAGAAFLAALAPRFERPVFVGLAALGLGWSAAVAWARRRRSPG
jgi:diacylglycerol kinase (ATP)